MLSFVEFGAFSLGDSLLLFHSGRALRLTHSYFRDSDNLEKTRSLMMEMGLVVKREFLPNYYKMSLYCPPFVSKL